MRQAGPLSRADSSYVKSDVKFDFLLNYVYVIGGNLRSAFCKERSFSRWFNDFKIFPP